MTPGTCRCGAQVFWAKTANDATAILEVKSRLVFVEAEMRFVRGYESHHAYCPKKGQFRRDVPEKGEDGR